MGTSKSSVTITLNTPRHVAAKYTQPSEVLDHANDFFIELSPRAPTTTATTPSRKRSGKLALNAIIDDESATREEFMLTIETISNARHTSIATSKIALA